MPKARLYADKGEAAAADASGVTLTASDQLSVDEFMADLRDQVRAELEQELRRAAEEPA